jgi:hypothetical protein
MLTKRAKKSLSRIDTGSWSSSHVSERCDGVRAAGS